MVFALILTGCGKKSSKDKNEIDGIKLDKNLTTYAFRYDPYDLNETEQVILRYNKSGELKYLEFDYIYDIDKIDETDAEGKLLKNKSDKEIQELLEKECECTEVKKLDYDDYKVVCEAKDHKATIGVSITDKTVKAGYLDYLKELKIILM